MAIWCQSHTGVFSRIGARACSWAENMKKGWRWHHHYESYCHRPGGMWSDSGPFLEGTADRMHWEIKCRMTERKVLRMPPGMSALAVQWCSSTLRSLGGICWVWLWGKVYVTFKRDSPPSPTKSKASCLSDSCCEDMAVAISLNEKQG